MPPARDGEHWVSRRGVERFRSCGARRRCRCASEGAGRTTPSLALGDVLCSHILAWHPRNAASLVLLHEADAALHQRRSCAMIGRDAHEALLVRAGQGWPGQRLPMCRRRRTPPMRIRWPGGARHPAHASRRHCRTRGRHSRDVVATPLLRGWLRFAKHQHSLKTPSESAQPTARAVKGRRHSVRAPFDNAFSSNRQWKDSSHPNLALQRRSADDPRGGGLSEIRCMRRVSPSRSPNSSFRRGGAHRPAG